MKCIYCDEECGGVMWPESHRGEETISCLEERKRGHYLCASCDVSNIELLKVTYAIFKKR